mmetsp:Transcript_30300/g.61680  ORF Transcript_30300/g.61680 Transcript_30300/m.61680 type:complete len:94 (+) Transcript_30300:955-1236(+)
MLIVLDFTANWNEVPDFTKNNRSNKNDEQKTKIEGCTIVSVVANEMEPEEQEFSNKEDVITEKWREKVIVGYNMDKILLTPPPSSCSIIPIRQ